MIARSALLSRASSRAYRKRLACAETMTGISAAHRSFHFTALVTRLALTTLLELRSGCGTNRLCRPVCKNFRNWRFTGLTMAVPVLLSFDPFRTSVERRTGPHMSRNQPAESLSPKMRCAIDACGSSSYSPKPSIWPAYLVFRALIRTLAAGPDEAGFWPVISNPSVTTWTPQFFTLE